MSFEDDECVRGWSERVGVSWRDSCRVFRRFKEEVLDKHETFRGMTPTELVEWQGEAKGRNAYLIKKLAQKWINSQPLRVKTKRKRLSDIGSFFLHNYVPLPPDRSFHFTSDLSPVEGSLTVEAYRNILLNSNKMYRAVFLMMGQALLGEGELVYINQNYCGVVLEALTKNIGVFKLTLPGRKQSRNVKNFFTMLSTNSDWATAMRDYLKSLPDVPRDMLFRNGQGNPLARHNIQHYFHRRAVESGVIHQFTPDCHYCGGETVKAHRLHPNATNKNGKKIEKVAYICKESSEHVNWACDMDSRFTGVRYGVNPHEIRDLIRSRWRASGAKVVVAEEMMQHGEQVDPNEYDKMKYTPGYAEKEYRLALPWLNVLSHDPDKISRFEVGSKLEASEAKVDVLSREVATLQRELRRVTDFIKGHWREDLENK